MLVRLQFDDVGSSDPRKGGEIKTKLTQGDEIP